MKFKIKGEQTEEKILEFSLHVDSDGDVILLCNGAGVAYISSDNGKLYRSIGTDIHRSGLNTDGEKIESGN